jgi:hypothetical protein
MKNYEEWKDLSHELDPSNPYSEKFVYDTGDVFYIEPVFYYKLHAFKDHYEDRYEEIIKEMERIVKRYHKVVFINDEDEEISSVDGAVYLTIQDVTNPLQIFVEDKSRGSDYGD